MRVREDRCEGEGGQEGGSTDLGGSRTCRRY